MTQQDEGEGMRTLEQRILAAAKAVLKTDTVGVVEWDELEDYDREAYVTEAMEVLTAFAPELFASPPEAWLAPWDVTLTMLPAAQAVYPGPVASFERWSAMRDAHLNPEDKSP